MASIGRCMLPLALTCVGLAAAQCNPTKGQSHTVRLLVQCANLRTAASFPCAPVAGFTSSYSIDFTTQSSVPSSNWIVASYEDQFLGYGSNGLEFKLEDGKSAPYIWTKNYMHYGTASVIMQTAPGIAIISSAVLQSDDLDEIDWEMSGNDYARKVPTLQTNYYGKGLVGTYDRSTDQTVSANMTSNFFNYTIVWTPTSVTWILNGTVLRTLLASSCDSGTHQFPQTPSRFHLGAWDAGPPGAASGTANWAGGYTPNGTFPTSMFVHSVSIKPYKFCAGYNYTDKSGSSDSVQCLSSLPISSSTAATSGSSTSNNPLPPVATTASCAPMPTHTQPGTASGCATYYLVGPGDDCGTIASREGVSESDLKSWNPQVGDMCYNLWANYYICASPPGQCTNDTATNSTIALSTTTSSESSTAIASSSSIVGVSNVSSSFSTTMTSTTASAASATTTNTSTSTVSTGTPVACPGSNGTTYASSGGPNFLIECGFDHYGNDFSHYQVTAVNPFQDCLESCGNSIKCVAITYIGSTCYLKSSVGTVVYDTKAKGAKIVSTVSASASGVSSGTSTIQGSTASVSNTADSSIPSSTSVTVVDMQMTSSSSPSSSSPTATSLTSAAGDDTSATPPSPVQDGNAVSVCNKWAMAKAGDSCSSFGNSNNIDPAYLYAWNTALGVEGEKCGTNLWAGYYYCVGIDRTTTSSSVSAAAVTTTSSTPSAASFSTTPASSKELDGTVPSASSPELSVSSSSSLISATKTSSSSTSPTASASGTASVLGFSYVDCYTEVSGRALTAKSKTASSMTNEICAAFCADYAYFGTEYSDECYCGGALVSGSVPTKDGRCKMKCAADSSQICGGQNGPSLYKSTTVAVAAVTSNVGSYVSMGCYLDNAAGRVMPTEYTSGNMTIELCAAKAKAGGYLYFGVEYGKECWMGKTLASSAKSIAQSRCGMLCPGNTTEFCGGGNALQMYAGLTNTSSRWRWGAETAGRWMGGWWRM